MKATTSVSAGWRQQGVAVYVHSAVWPWRYLELGNGLTVGSGASGLDARDVVGVVDDGGGDLDHVWGTNHALVAARGKRQAVDAVHSLDVGRHCLWDVHCLTHNGGLAGDAVLESVEGGAEQSAGLAHRQMAQRDGASEGVHLHVGGDAGLVSGQPGTDGREGLLVIHFHGSTSIIRGGGRRSKEAQPLAHIPWLAW